MKFPKGADDDADTIAEAPISSHRRSLIRHDTMDPHTVYVTEVHPAAKRMQSVIYIG